MRRLFVILLGLMAMALAEPVTVRGDAQVSEIVLTDAVLRVEWLDGGKPAREFHRETVAGKSVTTWQRDDANITQTVFFNEKEQITVVHLLADKPGALSFMVGLADAKPTGERGELATDGKRVWVLPFESEVTAEKNTQVIRGEGEAMIILATGAQATAKRWTELTHKYCGEEEHPDLSKVLAGIER